MHSVNINPIDYYVQPYLCFQIMSLGDLCLFLVVSSG